MNNNPEESSPAERQESKEPMVGSASNEDHEVDIGLGSEAAAVRGLEAEVLKLTAERDDLKDRMLRAMAELDNYRKRIKKEMEHAHEKGVNDLALRMVEVLDNLDRALAQTREEERKSGLAQGVELVHWQFLDVLSKFEIVPMETAGKPFDPRFHHSLMEETSASVPPGTVLEELVRGFSMRGRLLRPAQVKVSTAAVKSAPGSRDESCESKPAAARHPAESDED